MSRVLVLVGTRKGAFFCWSDESRREWKIEGPHLKGWEVTTLALDRRPDAALIYAGVTSDVYGANLQVSSDLGATWSQIEHGPRYAQGAERKVERIWTVAPGSEPDVVWVGVAEAGLFVSRDGGERFVEVAGLNDHPTREQWFPGAGGLCCHTLLIDPDDRERMWVGISAVGVFRTEDGGTSWQTRNEGLPIVDPSLGHGDIGTCVHKMVLAPDRPDTLYQQNHRGVFKSTDGGDRWQRIERHPLHLRLPDGDASARQWDPVRDSAGERRVPPADRRSARGLPHPGRR